MKKSTKSLKQLNTDKRMERELKANQIVEEVMQSNDAIEAMIKQSKYCDCDKPETNKNNHRKCVKCGHNINIGEN